MNVFFLLDFSGEKKFIEVNLIFSNCLFCGERACTSLLGTQWLFKELVGCMCMEQPSERTNVQRILQLLLGVSEKPRCHSFMKSKAIEVMQLNKNSLKLTLNFSNVKPLIHKLFPTFYLAYKIKDKIQLNKTQFISFEYIECMYE